jgi:hypothetical protein
MKRGGKLDSATGNTKLKKRKKVAKSHANGAKATFYLRLKPSFGEGKGKYGFSD